MKALVVRIVLAVTGWSWVRRIVTGTRFGRRVARRFVAGETLDEAIEAARVLNEAGMPVSLDHLGEHVSDRSLALRARDDYLACLDRLAAEGIDGNISIKLTQLGMGFDDDLCSASLDRLAETASAHGLTITIDMEESDHTDATISHYERSQRAHGNLGLAIQAYLHRTPADLERLVGLGGHVRLCKGAYDEPEELAHQSRGDVDDAYDRLLRDLMKAETVYPAIATHDDGRIEVAEALAGSRTAAFEYQMLYGVRADRQRELVAAGRPVRVYVPYGDSWYPYLTRRLGERPANLWFFVRALFGRR